MNRFYGVSGLQDSLMKSSAAFLRGSVSQDAVKGSDVFCIGRACEATVQEGINAAGGVVHNHWGSMGLRWSSGASHHLDTPPNYSVQLTVRSAAGRGFAAPRGRAARS